ncbi:lytic transglycosylase domain-containing protein [Mumia quercus]|uniref:aggregation-promoting factor C-terminal-like domain-containing protein n=1 Tax=Mumia quercus TaxID=2976125 RepID=UPI0021D0A6E8|nr:lytic transglycosylase domain-containing protein [Mumia quercus]
MSSPHTRARRKAAQAPLASRLLTRARTPRGRVGFTLSALAALALVGGAVAGATSAPPTVEAASVSGTEALAAETTTEKAAASGDRTEPQTSRSAQRPAAPAVPSVADAKKQQVAKAAKQRAAAKVKTARMQDKNPRAIAKAMLSDFGFGQGQYAALNKLWVSESNWRWNADNPTSSAYGIPQALPGSKMSSAGKDWKTNPATQIKWGLRYIKEVYGTPSAAWSFKQGNGWY